MKWGRRKRSDTWHFEPECRWYKGCTFWRTKKPTRGELCNACQAVQRRRKAKR